MSMTRLNGITVSYGLNGSRIEILMWGEGVEGLGKLLYNNGEKSICLVTEERQRYETIAKPDPTQETMEQTLKRLMESGQGLKINPPKIFAEKVIINKDFIRTHGVRL